MSKLYQYTSFGETFPVELQFDRYQNGRTRLDLYSQTEGPITTATVNIPEAKLAEGEVFIKTWSENKDLMPFLIANKIVEFAGRLVPVGFCTAVVCKLLVGPTPSHYSEVQKLPKEKLQ